MIIVSYSIRIHTGYYTVILKYGSHQSPILLLVVIRNLTGFRFRTIPMLAAVIFRAVTRGGNPSLAILVVSDRCGLGAVGNYVY